MTTIRLATDRDAAGIAKVYVDAWRSAYAAILPHRVLLGMSYERQMREWSWIIRNRTEVQPVIVAAEADGGVVGFASFGLARSNGRPVSARFAGERDATVGEIYTLYVQPEFQERGIGRELHFLRAGRSIYSHDDQVHRQGSSPGPLDGHIGEHADP